MCHLIYLSIIFVLWVSGAFVISMMDREVNFKIKDTDKLYTTYPESRAVAVTLLWPFIAIMVMFVRFED